MPSIAHAVRLGLLVLIAVLPLAGCDCAGTAPPTNTCTSSADCPMGSVCIDGMCSSPPDARMPAPPDAAMPDAPECVDLDRDMHFGMTATCARGDDCDDADPSRHPGLPETCNNGIDEDCDGTTDEPDCECRRGDRLTCYEGPSGTQGIGACHAGVTVCDSPGMVGACEGAVVPSDESCNYEDDDCDGQTDEGLRNACGECAEAPVEQCGNDVDDDCDGLTDEDCNCDYRCGCVPGTSCVCHPPTRQPCYEGPFGTEGRGLCAGGQRDCEASGADYRWGVCDGEVLPSSECGAEGADGQDQDCDGRVDEGCADRDGDGSPTPADCDDTESAVRPSATETCNGRDDDCDRTADEGVTNACGGCGLPGAVDDCTNTLDDDCDGAVNEDCECTPGASSVCYGGPAATLGVAGCRAGTMACAGVEFARWGTCEGSVGPRPEVCNGTDDDCDGTTDERWASGSNRCGFCSSTEICDMLDNDCDGSVDERVANRCGECAPEPVETCNGTDDDCDGTTDEGVTNACGTCPPLPCFTETWPDPAACGTEGRTCSDVVPSMDSPGAVTLGQTQSDLALIYLAVTAQNRVAQLNTDTGAVNWIRDSYGRWPSRTSVARDGSVWVANRAFTASDPNDPAQSNVVHLDIDGNLVCRAPVIGIARGLAIDGTGNVWAGTWNGQRLWQISGTDVDRTTSPPTCRVIAQYPVGVSIYGVTVDPDGFVWTASSPAIRLNSRDGTWTTVANPSFYGVAPDAMNQVWYGGWNGGGTIHAIRRDTLAVRSSAVGQVTAVTVHPDGSVWGSAYGTNQIVSVDPVSLALRCSATIPATSGTNPHGVAVDRLGRLWMPSRYGGYVNVYDTSCRLQATYPVVVGQELYSYSDMTGSILRYFTAPEGHWTQVYDSGYALAYWTEAGWTADTPAGTLVEVRARAADTVADLDAAPWCGPFATSPADLTGCAPALGRHRYLELDVRMATTRAGVRPTLFEAHASWAY